MFMYAKLDRDTLDIHECEEQGTERVDQRWLADILKSPHCKGGFFYAHEGPPENIRRFITEFRPKDYALSVRSADLDYVILHAKDFTGLTGLGVKDATAMDKRIATAFPGLEVLEVRGVSLPSVLLALPEMARGMKELGAVQFKGSELDVAHLLSYLDDHPGLCDRGWRFEARGGKVDTIFTRMLARRGIDYRTASAYESPPFHGPPRTQFSEIAKAEGRRRAAMLVMMASPPSSVSPCCKLMQRDGDRRIRKLVSLFLN
jgi:hypothetical protein